MSDTINPITIHKGPYRGKDEDGKPDNRILYVTAASPADDLVTYAEFTDTCTLGGILRMGVDRSSEDFYSRVSFAEFREMVAHELEWQQIEWRRKVVPKLVDLGFVCQAGCKHSVTFPRKDLAAAEICAEITDQTGVPTTIENGAVTIDLNFHKIRLLGSVPVDAAGPISEDEA
jgi:hypothetical protein